MSRAVHPIPQKMMSPCQRLH